MIFSLVNIVKAGIWTESLRYLDTVCLLVVLEKGSYHAWKSKRATVESMSELNLSVSILISELQTVSLI